MKILKFLALTMLLINTQASTTQPNSQNPPSKWQRFKSGAKNFARKHKAALSAAGGVVVGAGAAVGSYYAVKAARRKQKTNHSATTTAATTSANTPTQETNAEYINRAYNEYLYSIGHLKISADILNRAPREAVNRLISLIKNNLPNGSGKDLQELEEKYFPPDSAEEKAKLYGYTPSVYSQGPAIYMPLKFFFGFQSGDLYLENGRIANPIEFIRQQFGDQILYIIGRLNISNTRLQNSSQKSILSLAHWVSQHLDNIIDRIQVQRQSFLDILHDYTLINQGKLGENLVGTDISDKLSSYFP